MLNPDSPSSRGRLWESGLDDIKKAEDKKLALASREVERSLERHSDSLRDALPDFNLGIIYDRRVSLRREAYGFAKLSAVSSTDPAYLLKNVQNQIDWDHCHLHNTLTNKYETIVRPILDEVRSLQGPANNDDKGKLLVKIQVLTASYYEAATASIREHWAEAKRVGKQQEFINGWRARMLLCSASLGSVAGLDSSTEAPPAAPPKKVQGSSRETAVKTWIVFRLVDEKGHPVPNASYTVTLPDASIMSGTLDDQGLVRFDDIDPGQCKITFPKFDATEWKRAGS